MTALVIALAGTGIAGSASVGTAGADRSGGATEDVSLAYELPGTTRSADYERSVGGAIPSAARERCPDARRGLAFYRGRYAEHRAKMGAAVSLLVASRPRKPRNCADAGWLAKVWKQRAAQARIAARHYLARQRARTLRDYAFGAGNHAWPKAVQEVQRVFPGTNGWLLSCSAAEGGHGRWVGYGGQAYSTWLRDSDTVGGPMQFRYSTFRGMYRHALEYVRARRYLVPAHLRYVSDAAWRSALGQALAAGWARYTGNDNSHWSASWGNGC